GPTPLPVTLSATSRDISSLGLQWSQSLDPRLTRYELWRWSPPILGAEGEPGAGVRWAVTLVMAALLIRKRKPRRCKRASNAAARAWVIAVAGVLGWAALNGKSTAGAPRREGLIEGAIVVYEGVERDDTIFTDTALRPDWPYHYLVRVVTSDG